MKFIKKIGQDFQHKSRRKFLIKFIIVISLLIGYFIFASWRFGLKDGLMVMLITWSSFVLGTPIPDGGIIFDLPARYLLKIKMVFSETFVWIFAILLNVFNLLFNPLIYEKTFLLGIFKEILVEPFPYWIIIILSGAGTFLSLYFGDELYDVLLIEKCHRYKKHRKKLRLIMMLAIVVFLVIIYKILLNKLGVRIF